MHEIHILKDIFEDLQKQAKAHRISKVTKVFLKMGEFTEINEEILRYFFESHSSGTALEGAVLDIQKSPARELRLVSFDGE
jgi:Zn finger protein HypA/HybF involved in hydrogenase expression